MPKFFATSAATCSLSPVNIIKFFTPSCFNLAILAAASGRGVSPRQSSPENSEFIETNSTVWLRSRWASSADCSALPGNTIFNPSNSASLPTAIVLPETFAQMPWPFTMLKFSGSMKLFVRTWAASKMALPAGCSKIPPTEPASARTRLIDTCFQPVIRQLQFAVS